MHPLAKFCTDTVASLKGKKNTFGSPTCIDAVGAQSTCSSFLTLAIGRTYDVNAVVWSALLGRPWPRARDYYQALGRLMLGGDKLKVTDISTGTLGAIRYDEEQDGMSGHCFVVMEAPVATGGTRGALREYRLRVCDSCRASHGKGDTRESVDGGIGIGDMRLFVDSGGKVTGYSWSLGIGSDAKYNGKGQSLAFANIPSDWSSRHG